MNKSELIDVIAEAASVSKTVAAKTLDSLLASMTRALAKGEDITLIGFGSFTVRERKARVGRNPKTGAALQIAASRVVGFKAGKTLKDTMQKG